MAFKSAFAAARKAGKKEFTYNGKRYTTKLKSETKSSPKAGRPKARPTSAPAKSSRPKARATSAPAKAKRPQARSRTAPATSSRPVARGTRSTSTGRTPAAPNRSAAMDRAASRRGTGRSTGSLADKHRRVRSRMGR